MGLSQIIVTLRHLEVSSLMFALFPKRESHYIIIKNQKIHFIISNACFSVYQNNFYIIAFEKQALPKLIKYP
jgi:hypothetical protein